MKNIAAIIPAYNPQQSLITFVHQLLTTAITQIIVVNDGSDAKYKDIFENLKQIDGCQVLQHDSNIGKGGALKTAFTYIQEHRRMFRGVLTVGAHNQHTLQDIKLILTMTKVFSEGIVLGVRNFHSTDSTFFSYWGNRATTLLFELLYHRKLMDTQTGLRYISINELPWLIKVKGERYDYDTNMLITALKRKCPIFEVEIGQLRVKKNTIIQYDEIANAGTIITKMLMNYLKPRL
ncbi:glycosyltransferase family 2 protein [Lysinibacillus macroides]|uniref:Dolichyl-phosphate mannose synthase n=1 Tax=Lysinibacillus macroides TaxID=33935 RepID=A0A0N0CWZ5_9BACI|nr:glycosyltransferase family 2 protein [Lysinibacillus macroides]KOY83845.1 dolichyl-phosphate mannose synthase [Lysinibacillus macroides]QPR67120.1 glycosyltransferase family 2 protein [Lysinibacillus macroides]